MLRRPTGARLASYVSDVLRRPTGARQTSYVSDVLSWPTGARLTSYVSDVLSRCCVELERLYTCVSRVIYVDIVHIFSLSTHRKDIGWKH